jgi:hypothetical protein
MGHHDWHELIDQLRGTSYQFGLITQDSPVHRIEFDYGLSDSELIAAEARFGFRFPPDLRDFLQTALPNGPRFPNWRSGDESMLRDWIDSPLEGILFDVEHNGFWLEEWGPAPRTLADAKLRVTELVTSAPRLIPIYGHRMIPDEPQEAGNPIFSVHQTDIIHYGFDLADYIRHEFQLPGRKPWPEQIRPIRFWNLDRFQEVRWAHGPCVFDNSDGQLP